MLMNHNAKSTDFSGEGIVGYNGGFGFQLNGHLTILHNMRQVKRKQGVRKNGRPFLWYDMYQ